MSQLRTSPTTHARPVAVTRVAAIVVAATVVACSDAPAPATTVSAVPVTVVTPQEGVTTSAITTTGVYESRDEIPLAFKIGGVLVRLVVDEGAAVRRGQAIAALDLREIDAAVAKATVAVEKASRDEARVRRLLDDSVATRTQWQDAQSALDAARADLSAARVNREYATIVAPEDGVILRRVASPGTNVAAGAPIVVLGGARRGRVLRAGLSDRDALRAQVGDGATVKFDAVPDRVFHGRVSLLGRAADARTGTFTVEIALRDADALPSGLVGAVTLHPRSATRAPLLPVDALVEADGDSATVYTVRGVERDTIGTATAQRVQISALLGDQVAVRGLQEGARVIARGAPYVVHGSRVRIVRARAVAEAP